MELGEHVESSYSTSCAYYSYYLCIIIPKKNNLCIAAGFLLTAVQFLASLDP